MKRNIFLRAISGGIAAFFATFLAVIAASASAFGAVNIVVTTNDLASIARAVAGENAQITVLARPSEDPHFVDARPSFLRVLRNADLLIEGGADLESGWLPPLINNARNSKILSGAKGHFSAATAAKIPLRDVPTALDRSQGDVHAHGNPHFLLDPENAAKVANALATKLIEIYPDDTDGFRVRASRFSAEISRLQREWKERLARFRDSKIVTYHRSFDYLLAAYGLVLADTIEPKPGIEPSGSYLIALTKRCRTSGVKLVIAEPNRSGRLCERVSRDIGVPLLRMPLMPENAVTSDAYFVFMDKNIRELETVLKGLPAGQK